MMDPEILLEAGDKTDETKSISEDAAQKATALAEQERIKGA
jgi:hypothetical protein